MASRLDPAQSNISNEAIANFAIECDQAQRDIDEATGRKRAVLKRAKAAGVDTKILIQAIGLKRQDEEQVKLEMRNLLRYANVIAPYLPLSQADLFDGVDNRKLNAKATASLQDWEAEKAGYEAGINGGSMDDCTHPAGSRSHTAFNRGFTRGAAFMQGTAEESAPKVASTRHAKRRGNAAAQSEPEEPDEGEEEPIADARQMDLEGTVPRGQA